MLSRRGVKPRIRASLRPAEPLVVNHVQHLQLEMGVEKFLFTLMRNTPVDGFSPLEACIRGKVDPTPAAYR
jgi:hypothetical protein